MELANAVRGRAKNVYSRPALLTLQANYSAKNYG